MRRQPRDPLLTAAHAALGGLTAAEEHLVECFGAARPACFPKAEDGEPTAEARAEVLRWLLANASLGQGSRVRGLHVTHLRIPDGELDLDGISADYPILLEHCRLGSVLLRDARLVTLKLTGTHCDGIEGDRLRVDHGLLLNNGFRSYRRAALRAISVGDDLNCIGGRVAAGTNGWSALQLDGARVGGRLYLSEVKTAPRFEHGSDEPLARDR